MNNTDRMRPVKKRPTTVQEMEKNIHLLLEQENYSAVKPDGSLSEHFVLSYLIRNDDNAAETYGKIHRAYEKVKLHDGYKKVMEARKVSKKTLQSIVLFYECLVRPIKVKDNIMQGSIHVGEILKLPKVEYDEAEQWKASLDKDEKYKVGDKVFYNMKSNIVLDNELLHLVGMPTGKLLQ